MPADLAALREISPGISKWERLTLVLSDQKSRWLAGSPLPSESYLAELPEVAADRECRLAVVEGEIRSRREVGEMPTLAEFLGRFPDLAEEVTRLFDPEGDGPHPGAGGSHGSDGPTEAYGPSQRECAARVVDEFIGRYQILRIIGEGGFGLVYLARDDLLGRSVAIKVPRPDRLVRDEEIDAFLNEARILAGLDHENIVPVYDVGRTHEGHCFVVSKWIDGQAMTRRALAGQADIARVALLIAAVADALEHAHRKGLVHRDVKPSNILIDAAGKPYLADFGLALREEDFLVEMAVAGTPAYMSPEQARGEWHRVDGRTDIFSLGIVLYELISGGHPYGSGPPSTIMRRIAMETPIPPRRVDRAIPAELERICLRALAPRASDRYAAARELAEELRLFAAEATTEGRAIEWRGAEGTAGPSDAAPSGEPTLSWGRSVVPRGLRSFGPEDGAFFLGLLHGPRDRAGLPQSIRFWKERIEALASFPVGVIYGPSGCGKSSMVRAGLLPRLSPRVVAIDEPATSDLGPRLLARIGRLCPGIGPGATLVEALAEVRRGTACVPGSKLLIVLDQFEQWLHARGAGPDDELARALRQCDGERLQALIVVRVDFWMAAGRFMRELEVPVVEGENAAPVDLFPPAHARRVLTAFGAAYGALPAPPEEPGEEARAFLDRAVVMMTQEGTVSPVRLSLFAEMARNRPWTAATLDDLGGAVGIGVRFLDEAFVEPAATPENRSHREAASRVLAALLPAPGDDIRGQVRSRCELLDASGYRDAPARFDALMEILDAGTRLLTPMATADADDVDHRHYQLTHDYLVPSIREWLARHQRETRRGRAELTLAERASLWSVRREPKQLPTLPEWGSIRMLTDPGRWNETQRDMIRAADRSHLARAGRWAVLLAAIGLGALGVRRAIDEDRNRARADGLVRGLLVADSPRVPAIVAELEPYRRWADRALVDAVRDPSTPATARLHARIALLPVDPRQSEPLVAAMLEADPAPFAMIRDALGAREAVPIPRLWREAESPASPPDAAFRAAVALSRFDPDDDRWAGLARPVVRQLVGQPSLLVPAWVDLLRPVRDRLAPALAERARDPAEDSPLVASILADYAADRPDLLAATVGEAGPAEFSVLLGSRWKDDPRATAALAEVLAALLRENGPEPRDATAREIANLAIALLRLGRGGDVWPLLESRPDPGIRSYLIDRMATLGCDPALLVARLRGEGDASIRAALMMALGRFDADRPGESLRAKLAPELLDLFRDDTDPQVHAASGWLLRRWGRTDRVAAVEAGLATGKVEGGRRWYINSQGQTMVVLPGREDFRMGSPEGEPWRRTNEDQRLVRILPFDIGVTEVTIGQFAVYVEDRSVDHREYRDPAGTDPQRPRNLVSWYDAVDYCNWLCEREGLPRDQWCYEPDGEGKYRAGMRIAPDYLGRSGYRLPTDAEWEFACRAGTVTSRSFGDSIELLARHAWYAENTSDRTCPIGLLLPNGHGLFDLYGNVAEWCQNADGAEADGDDPVVSDYGFRNVRGGGFSVGPGRLRSACRFMDRPGFRNDAGGFRLVRSRPEAARRDSGTGTESARR